LQKTDEIAQDNEKLRQENSDLNGNTSLIKTHNKNLEKELYELKQLYAKEIYDIKQLYES